MKAYSKKALFKRTFATILILLLLCLGGSLYILRNKKDTTLRKTSHLIENSQVLGVQSQKIARILPVRLKIPNLNIDAAVEQVSLTSGGVMDVPANIMNVGWYNLGPSPGERGNAVIAGHFNSEDGGAGVFNNLAKLKKGDKISVLDNIGITTDFIVRESRTYEPGYAEEVFSTNDSGVYLNLVTCDGVWNKDKNSYSKRLVVFSDLAQ